MNGVKELSKEIIEATSYWYLSGMSRTQEETSNQAIQEVETIIENFLIDKKNKLTDEIDSYRDNVLPMGNATLDPIRNAFDKCSKLIKKEFNLDYKH